MQDLFVGKQPILDTNKNLYAYELLYRNGPSNQFPDIDPELATVQVILNAFLSPGFEQIAAKKNFINFSEKLLMTDVFATLNPKKVVIEVLEDVKMTGELIDRLKELHENGFEIALDDFVLENEYDEFPELFEIVKFIKVDFLLTTAEERQRIVHLKQYFPHLVLLAEKIETDIQFREAKLAGYELFQGYFFAKPEIVQSTKLPTDYVIYFNLLEKLSREDTSINHIAEIVMKDVSLTYKLLKQTNTYEYQSTQKINSIRQAITRIGLKEFKRWIQFLIVFREQSTEDGRAKFFANNSLTRAAFCEQLAIECQLSNYEEFYMLGMFSLMDVILKREPKDIFPVLPVTDLLIRTFLGEETEMTIFLEIAREIEGMNFDRAIELSKKIGINEQQLSRISLEAAKAV